MPHHFETYGRSYSSSNLSLRRSKSTTSYTVRRSYSSADLSGTSYDDVIDFCRPWYSKYYTGKSDDFWFYRMFYGARSPSLYSRTSRAPQTSYWSTLDPLYYRGPYYSSYKSYPNKWWLTPSYFETKYYDYNYRPYSWSPYSWYYPRRYHYDLYY